MTGLKALELNQVEHQATLRAPATTGFDAIEEDLFSSEQWFELLLDTCARTDEEQFFLPIHTESERASWPLVEKRGRWGLLRFSWLESLSNFYSLSYRPSYTGHIDGAMSQALAKASARELRRLGHPWLEFKPLPSEDGFWPRFAQALEVEGFNVSLEHMSTNWVYENPPETIDAYLRERPSQVRNTYRRRLKRLNKAHEIEFKHFRTESDDVDAGIDMYLEVYEQCWKRPEPFPRFIPELLRLLAAHRMLRLGVLEVDGTPVAAQIWVRTARRSLLFKLAHDARYATYSPGTVLLVEMLRVAIEEDKADLIDFGSGADRYKSDWMKTERSLERLLAINPRTVLGALRVGKQYMEAAPVIRDNHMLRDWIRSIGVFRESYANSRLNSDGYAVVVGACGHGLAIIRSLAQLPVSLFVLEAHSRSPGAATRYGDVRIVPDINGPGLIDSLQELRTELPRNAKPVLFLTNDNMVRTIGSEWERLEGLYELSWSDCRASILPLLDKGEIEARCAQTGLNYPRSLVIDQLDSVADAASSIGFPLIIKPTRPLSGFKTFVPTNLDDLENFAAAHADDLPFIAQQLVPGEEKQTLFTALVFSHGQAIAKFVGRKLRSRPRGHTTVAEPWSADDVLDTALTFFNGLALSGPASLEVKRAPDGTLWVIEPTVGRTDFWIDLCTQNGVDFPQAEFSLGLHQRFEPAPASNKKTVWINEDRDTLGFFWYLFVLRGDVIGRRFSFLYLHLSDLRPMLRFIRYKTLGLLQRFISRLSKILRRSRHIAS